MARLVAFPFYGGKSSRLSFILPNLPDSGSFIEPFCGSAAVLLNRKRSKVETINDLDGEIVNFFRQLRDHPEDLYAAVKATPFAREEFAASLIQDDTDDPIERARKFFVRHRQSFGAQGYIPSDWGFSRNPVASIGNSWRNAHEKLPAIVHRLQGVQLEHRSAVEIIERFDHEEALFYIDPPYYYDGISGMEAAQGGRKMRREREHPELAMDEDDHVILLETLSELKGKVAISGYPAALYDDLLKGWRRVERELLSNFKKDGERGARTECLWMNY